MTSHLPEKLRVQESVQSIEIISPSPRSHTYLAGCTLWIIGWLYCESFFITQIMSPPAGAGTYYMYMIPVALLWSAAGIWVLSSLIWMLNGKEILILENKKLTYIRKSIFNRKERIFLFTDLKRIRVNRTRKISTWGTRNLLWANKYSGAIQFESGYRTYTIFNALTADEADILLQYLVQKNHVPKEMVIL